MANTDIYFDRGTSLFVNLYAPSQVMWSADGVPVTLSQETQYPDDGEVEFLVRVPRAMEFSVAFGDSGVVGIERGDFDGMVSRSACTRSEIRLLN